MAYDQQLADKVREHLSEIKGIEVEEKKMFRGLAFMVNKKMCVNISGDNLMCRFDPALKESLSERRGFMPMVMKGKEMNGYCYVSPEGLKTKKELDFWIKQCLDFNDRAKRSKK